MLTIIRSTDPFPYHSIMQIYEESIIRDGQLRYARYSSERQKIEAEQDLYQYLKDAFFRQADAFLALWTVEGQAASALRMEPYQDGFLLNALETSPAHRNRGYASCLIKEMLAYFRTLSDLPVYSHIDQNNLPSMKVHQKAGFVFLNPGATQLNGTHIHTQNTYRYIGKDR